jgi:hypothetical protein
MTDGQEFDSHAGQVLTLPAGHDGWVVGDEPVVAIDWKPKSNRSPAIFFIRHVGW